jgi:16S rRNA C1402 N4-methylase RsmH
METPYHIPVLLSESVDGLALKPGGIYVDATLCDYDTILETALETNYISDADVKTLQIWRKDPANWKPRIQ